MNQNFAKELGIIFIVNYPFTEFTENNDTLGLKEDLLDFQNGLFKYSAYIPNDKAEIYFVSSFPDGKNEPDSPNTIIRKLQIKNRVYDEREDINFGSINLGNRDVLSGILIYLFKVINAKNYVLFFYNHSSSFGLFSNKADALSSVSRPAAFEKSLIRYTTFKNTGSFMTIDELVQNKVFGFTKNLNPQNDKIKSKEKKEEVKRKEISGDFKADMLTNSELLIALQRAVELSRPESKNLPTIQVLFNAGCYSLNIDLAYTLKDAIQYLVGAEGIMPPLAYDYPLIVNSLLDQLRNDSEIDFKNTIQLALKKFDDKYDRNNPIHEKWLNGLYVSAVDCSKVEKLKNKLNDIIFYWMSSPDDIVPKVLNSLIDSNDLSRIYNAADSPFHIYDLKRLISNLTSNENDGKAKNLYENFLQCLKELTPFEGFYGNISLRDIFGSISIYFPPTFDIALKAYNFPTFYTTTSTTASFFAKESFWVEFLNFYYKYLTKILIPREQNLKAIESA